MKIEFYVDIYPGINPSSQLYATTAPGKKIEGSKRYRISANIPESAFYGEVDADLPVDSVDEVDKD